MIIKTKRSGALLCSLLVMLSLLKTIAIYAGDSMQAARGMDQLDVQLGKELKNPLNTTIDSLQKVFTIEQIKSDIANEQYYRQSVVHRSNTFQWQYTSGRLIFILVIVTVLCGLVYSGIQFYYSITEIKTRGKILQQQEENKKLALQAAVAGRAVTPGDGVTPENTGSAQTGNGVELEMSMGSIKITSSLVGIVILVISIAFFFLYLQFIYPIEKFRVDTDARRTVTKDSVTRR